MRLILEGVSRSLGGRLLYRDIDLRLEGGQALTLRGPNGSGKSTLLRHIAGLSRGGGEIRLEDDDRPRNTGDPPIDNPVDAPIDASIGDRCHYIGHREALKPTLSVEENLDFHRRLLAAETTIETALQSFDLDPLRRLPCARLSEGQRKRVALARLRLARRPLWLLDEPLTNLDADAAMRFMAMLRAHLDAGGLAAMAVHHPLPNLAAACLELSAKG